MIERYSVPGTFINVEFELHISISVKLVPETKKTFET